MDNNIGLAGVSYMDVPIYCNVSKFKDLNLTSIQAVNFENINKINLSLDFSFFDGMMRSHHHETSQAEEKAFLTVPCFTECLLA